MVEVNLYPKLIAINNDFLLVLLTITLLDVIQCSSLMRTSQDFSSRWKLSY